MCDPLTITAIAAVGATVAQQQQASHAANKYEDLLYGQRKDQALAQFAQLREREFQERERAAQDIASITRQARQAQSAAKLQALESGVGGASVAALMNEFERGQLASIGTVRGNLAATSAQLHEEARAAGYVQKAPRQFGPLDTGFGIAAVGLQATGAGLNAYAAGHPTPPPA